MTFRETRRWAQNFFVTLVAHEVDLWVHPTVPAPLGWFHAIDLYEATDIIDCFQIRWCSVDEANLPHVIKYMEDNFLHSLHVPRLIIEEEP